MDYDSNITSIQKAAILLISLGKDYCSKVFKYFDEHEIEKLTLEISKLNTVGPEIKDMVIKEFCELFDSQKYDSEGGLSFVKDVLDMALGQQKAYDIISKLDSSTINQRPFVFTEKLDHNQILNLIKDEHPQTIALVFSFLDTKKAAAVLNALPQDIQTSVIERIAKMGKTSPEYIKEIERILEKKFLSSDKAATSSIGGINTSVAILNSVDRGTEKNVLQSLEQLDSELAKEIKGKMFLFEDLIKLEKNSIQRVLREASNDDLVYALKGVTEEFADVVFTNMSSRLQEIIKEDMELKGSVRIRDIEEAQQRIVDIVRRLDDAGEIIIQRDQEGMIIG